MENNHVTMIGEIATAFAYSHNVFGEEFYRTDVLVSRLSHTADLVPMVISERLIDVTKDCQRQIVKIDGQFRSYNYQEGKKKRLGLSVFANKIELEPDKNGEVHTNQISLNGYICKEPVYRKTPRGREITDVMLAVNRPNGKSDYIPCVCWGEHARMAETLEVGKQIGITGRIQSREYIKMLEKEEAECRIAYEVSVTKVKEM